MKDIRAALFIGRNTEGTLIKRPLSPHLQVYKPQMSSATSIFHRITGCALSAGTLLLTAWLVCASTSDHAFAVIQGIMASWLGLLVLFGFTASLFYHFCNGIRHLAWDAGRGYDLAVMHRTGWTMLVATAVLTIGFWIVGFVVMTHG